MKKIIYLTGPPGSGKSTLAETLRVRHDAEVLSYGASLTERAGMENQEELRKKSSAVITPALVTDLDDEWASRVASSSSEVIVIDSHALTREDYGFRAIPFSVESLRRFGLTQIVCLIARPEVLHRRHAEDPGGRKPANEFQMRAHNDLQAALALTYSHVSACPVYFLDAEVDRETLLKSLIMACGIN